MTVSPEQECSPTVPELQRTGTVPHPGQHQPRCEVRRGAESRRGDALTGVPASARLSARCLGPGCVLGSPLGIKAEAGSLPGRRRPVSPSSSGMEAIPLGFKFDQATRQLLFIYFFTIRKSFNRFSPADLRSQEEI